MKTQSSGMISVAAIAVMTLWTSICGANYKHCCGNPIKWASSSIELRASVNSYSPTGTWRTRINDAAEEWTDLPRSSVDLSVVSDSNGVGWSNTESEIWHHSGYHADGALMVTTPVLTSSCGYECCGCTPAEIVEKDIVVYAKTDASTPIVYLSGMPEGEDGDFPEIGSISFIVAMQHEMGHVIGLTHTPHGLARMAPNYPAGGWIHSGAETVKPRGADQADAFVLYPDNTSFSNLYMANVQSLNDGGVSWAWPLSTRESPIQVDYYPRNKVQIAGQLPNRARVGDTIQFRVCYGNLGNSAVSYFDMDFYLSDDPDWHPTSHIDLGSSSRSALSAYQSYCFRAEEEIPAGTPTGSYFIHFGSGTSGDNIAVLDRQIVIIN